MKAKASKPKMNENRIVKNVKKSLAGYPLYPAREDIFNKCQVDIEINPEDTFKHKELTTLEKIETSNIKDFKDDFSGSDLDVPGAELDDIQENIGSEDEENNYYSLGGENHNDLAEDKGE